MVCERFTQTLFIILGYFASRAVRSLKCFTCSLHKVTTTLLNFLHQHSTLCPVWIQQWTKCQTIHKLGVALLGVRIPPVTSSHQCVVVAGHAGDRVPHLRLGPLRVREGSLRHRGPRRVLLLSQDSRGWHHLPPGQVTPHIVNCVHRNIAI